MSQCAFLQREWPALFAPMLERLRRRLRDLIKLIEKQKRKPIYTDFEDEMGDGRRERRSDLSRYLHPAASAGSI